MRKKIRLGAALLALLLCAGMSAPAFAADNPVPDGPVPKIEITWLSIEGKPESYNPELGWLTWFDWEHGRCTIDLATGKQVEYDEVSSFFSEGLAQVVKYGEDGPWKFGFIDATGTLVISLEDGGYTEFSEGLAFVGEHFTNKGSFIDKTGAVVISVECNNGSSKFSEGLAQIARTDAAGNVKYGFIDKTGEVVIPLEYDAVSDFSEGLALVGKHDENWDWKYGYIDKTGSVVVPLEYDFGYDFSNGLARAGKYYEDWYFPKYGYIDRTGQVVIPIEYYHTYGFHDGLTCAAKYDADGNWGYHYLDTAGNVVLSPEYDMADDFFDGLAAVAKRDADGNYKFGYIDKTGALVIPLEYGSAGGFSDGLAFVGKYDADGNYKLGFIDKTGAVVVPLEYDDAGFVYGGENNTARLCWVRQGDRYGIVDNPYHMSVEAPGAEPANTGDPKGESPGPIPSDPGGQDAQNSQAPANLADTGNTADPGGGFPIVPVVIVLAAAAAAGVAAALALKKKTR